MKILILMRHGKASASAESDALRPLTGAGLNQIKSSAHELLRLGYKPGVLLCSPLLRAVQSAQAAGEILGANPQSAPELDGRLSAKGLIEFAYAQLQKADCVMLVGHNPNLSIAAGLLREEFTPFDAGAFAVFDLSDAAAPRLLALGA